MVGTQLDMTMSGSITRSAGIIVDNISFEPLTPNDVEPMAELIRRNLESYEEAGSVLAATFRRLTDLYANYQAEGSIFIVAKDLAAGGACIGGAGLGTLHGLPLSEGMGEIRDMVLEESYRGRGIGTRLLRRCLDEARDFNYKRLYLETTPQMEKAQKLFIRFGFRAITQGAPQAKPIDKLPCYFVLEEV